MTLTFLKSENESFTAHDVNARAGSSLTRHGPRPPGGHLLHGIQIGDAAESILSTNIQALPGRCAQAATVRTAAVILTAEYVGIGPKVITSSLRIIPTTHTSGIHHNNINELHLGNVASTWDHTGNYLK